MNKRVMPILFFFLIILSTAFVSANCYLIRPTTESEIALNLPLTTDSDCKNINCLEQNPLTPEMYDTGSCVLYDYSNCTCAGDIISPAACSSLSFLYYNSSVLLQNKTTSLGTCPGVECGECGKVNKTSGNCDSDDPIGDSNCKFCNCTSDRNPQCKIESDLTGGKLSNGEQIKCEICDPQTFDLITAPVGTFCIYNATFNGSCDNSKNCIPYNPKCIEIQGIPRSLETGTWIPNGTTCPEDQICDTGVWTKSLDTDKCCLGKCTLPGLVFRNCADVGKKCNLTIEKCSGTLNETKDVKKCCLGECTLMNCSEMNGKICAEGENCNGQSYEASDSKCCLGECTSSESAIDWKLVLIVIAIVVIIAILIMNPGILGALVGMLKGML